MSVKDFIETCEESCRLAAEAAGHDRYHAEECMEGGTDLCCPDCPFE